MKNVASIAHQIRHLSQMLSLGLLVVLAGAVLIATLGAALGALPWLSLGATFGEASRTDVGPWVQIGLTVVLVALCFFVPSSLRVLRLEASHRRFSIGMEDIARAYHSAHADDRRGAFRMRAEFDAVRERLAHLREHPELGHLEPDVLEVAAQMSIQARHLAEVYSDEKVSRARRFLEQRQEEVERTRELVARAHHTARHLKRWSEDLAEEEGAVRDQRERLEEELREILPQIGYVPEEPAANVVRMPVSAAE